MPIIQPKYTRQNLEKTDVFPVRFSKAERLEFEKFKYSIQQHKDSTAIKQLAWIGGYVIQEKKMLKILEVALNNYRLSGYKNVVKFDSL